MAITTTARNACDASVWLDTAGGTLTDISGSSANIAPSFDLQVGEYRVFQDRWPKRIDCGKDASITLNVWYSTTADEGFDILIDWFFTTSPGARTFSWYQPSKNVGSDYFTGEFRLDDLSWTNDPSDPNPVMVTATLLPDGTVSHSVAATA